MMKQNKHLYQFTLVLANVDDATPKLEDSLYQAGCDDALVNFRNGTVYLDFEREAATFEEAVMSALRDVESSDLGAKVVNVAPENLVTEAEIAKRLDMKRQTISLWIKGERRYKTMSFPKPVMKLSDRSPLWKWREIVEWLYQNKIIKEHGLLEKAEFLENVNAVLDVRDVQVRKYRQDLLEKIEQFTHSRH